MRRTILTAAVLSLLVPAMARAQRPTPAAADTARPTAQDFDRLVRDATLRQGFFDLYEKADKLYLVVPRERLGQEFLLSYQIARGIGASGLFGGTMLNIFETSLVALERHGDRVYLVQRPHRFTAADSATRSDFH